MMELDDKGENWCDYCLFADPPGEDVIIASYARTPMGNFQGALSSVGACQLAALAIARAVERAQLDGERVKLIDEVILGNVFSAGLGQAPATHAARLAGLPPSIPTTCVNKVCASGMKAIMNAANSIRAGQADIVVAGGMESMSQAPFLLPTVARTGGFRFGDQTIIDSIRLDGLTDAESGWGMGLCSEKCAEDHELSRAECDDYARQSYERALAAEQLISQDIVPVVVPAARGKPPLTVTADEAPHNYNPAKMLQLKTIFKEDGTTTAANASPMSDGAAALIICSGAAIKIHRLPVLAKIIGWADASQRGVDFTTSPALAIPRALARAQVALHEVDCFEINEAFSSVALANIKRLGLDPQRVNKWGGAVALGHPLGCSGARITGTLVSILRAEQGKIGVAAVCNGGGGASAIVLERF